MEKKWFRIYINSVGGGTECEGPYDYKTEDDAMEEARLKAIDDYETYEGYHGIPDIDDIAFYQEYSFNDLPNRRYDFAIFEKSEPKVIIRLIEFDGE